jgi:hypothetical protein
LIGLAAVGGRHRDTDAGADDQLVSLHLERLGQFGDDLAGKLAGAGWRRLPLHDCELVSAQARHRVVRSHHPLQPFGNRTKQRVAD